MGWFHTIAFVENAPDIERKLHQHFHECRINKENDRKEFFAVAIKDVREALESLGVESEWYFDVEAREHSESELIRAAKKQTQSRPAETVYPEAI